MKVRPFLRTPFEYKYSRNGHKGRIYSGQFEIKYIEHSAGDELYKRCKEAARCYMAIGNIPMMLNKLYSTINLENRIYRKQFV